MINLINKYCPRCKEEKLISSFSKNKSTKDGYAIHCRECKSLYDKEYKARHCEEIKAKAKEYRKREDVKERVRKAGRKYKKANIEKIKIAGRNYFANPEKKQLRKEYLQQYEINNPGKIAEIKQRWANNNSDKRKISSKNYMLKRRGWEDSGFILKKSDIDIMYGSQNGKCFYCDGDLGNYHIDHIIPLSKGGEHKLYNLVLSCPTCNLTKNARDPEEFVNELLSNN